MGGLFRGLRLASEYGWSSAYYSSYWVDPAEHLVFLILMQLIPTGGLDLSERFHALVESALVSPGKRPVRHRRGAQRPN